MHYRSTGVFFWVLVALVGALVAVGVAVLGGWRRGVPPPPGARARAVVRALALVLAALPVATYLADLAPWERAGHPLLALLTALVVADLVVAAVAGLGPWRRHRLGPPLAVLVLTWATLLGDVVTGSHLELNGLLGYDAIVAGRFIGYGNLTFGLHAVSALLVTAATATVVGRRARPERRRLATGGTALGMGLVTVGIIGTPSLGRDFGGVLAALPGFLILAMVLAGVRVTWLRMVAVLGAAVVAVGTVAFLDWLRPADQRSHLGRFVEQILTGEAWTVVSRKGQANLDILRGSPLAWMLPVAILAAVWLIRPGGLLRGRPGAAPGGLPAADAGVLRAGLLAVLLSLTLGAARQRLRRRGAGDRRGAAHPAARLAGRGPAPRGHRNEGDRGRFSARAGGRGTRPCYGRIPWIDRLERLNPSHHAAFFTTPSRRSSSSSPAALSPPSARA